MSVPETPRKAIPKRLRFEVMRRDNYTCRYFCGIGWKKVNRLQEVAREILEAERVEQAEDDAPEHPPVARTFYNRGPAVPSEEAPADWRAARDAIRKGLPDGA